MNEINVYIGGQIRKYRKANGMTLQQLADVIHKSRATVCKYENGEISIFTSTRSGPAPMWRALRSALFPATDAVMNPIIRATLFTAIC